MHEEPSRTSVRRKHAAFLRRRPTSAALISEVAFMKSESTLASVHPKGRDVLRSLPGWLESLRCARNRRRLLPKEESQNENAQESWEECES